MADFQGVQFMLAGTAMKLDAARQLTCAAAAKSERAMTGELLATQGWRAGLPLTGCGRRHWLR